MNLEQRVERLERVVGLLGSLYSAWRACEVDAIMEELANEPPMPDGTAFTGQPSCACGTVRVEEKPCGQMP